MLRSNAPILQETAKRNFVRHPPKLSNILVERSGFGREMCMIKG